MEITMFVTVVTGKDIQIVPLEAYENEIRKKQSKRKYPYYVDIFHGTLCECLRHAKQNNLGNYMNIE